MASPKLTDRVERAIEDRTDEEELERAPAPVRRRLITGAFWLTVCGVSLYLVGPTVLDTLDEADQVRGIAPGWLAAMAAPPAPVPRLSLGTAEDRAAHP